MSGSKPGERRGGRQKGTPNKVTRTLREAILQALDEAGGEGGAVAYLRSQAKFESGGIHGAHWENFAADDQGADRGASDLQCQLPTRTATR
jgi:hypothetical protein